VWSSRWDENWQGKPKYSGKTCPSAIFSTINPAWPDLGSNPGRYRGKYTDTPGGSTFPKLAVLLSSVPSARHTDSTELSLPTVQCAQFAERGKINLVRYCTCFNHVLRLVPCLNRAGNDRAEPLHDGRSESSRNARVALYLSDILKR
jgi:hypothetical protein